MQFYGGGALLREIFSSVGGSFLWREKTVFPVLFTNRQRLNEKKKVFFHQLKARSCIKT